MRHGFVAGNGNRAVQRAATARFQRSGGGTLHFSSPKVSLTGRPRRGKRPPFQHNPFFMGSKSLVKADLGLKRVCPNCSARFYDLQKRPIDCPKCHFTFEPEALYKQRRPRQPEPVAAQPVPADTDDEETESEDEESEDAEEIVEPVPDEAPLVVAATGEDEEEEEPAEETETEGTGMQVVDEDDIEDIVVEDDDEEEDDSLLEDDEDENDDVSGIIDADIEKDER